MLEIFKTTLILILTILIGAVTIFYIYVKSGYSYFKKLGIPYDKPVFPFGSFGPAMLLKTSFNGIMAEIYSKNKGHKLVGFFSLWQKQILVTDPEIIKHILVKDFDVFTDRGVYHNKDGDPLSAHLFAIEGYEWKSLRAKISPTFSSGKIKGMHPIIIGCANVMADCISDLIKEKKPVDYQEVCSKYGLETISTTAFGLDSKCLTDEESKFARMAKKMIAPTFDRMLGFVLVLTNSAIGSLFKLFNLAVTPKPVANYFLGLVKENVSYRETNNVNRNDYMQLLIQLKNTGTLDDEEGTKVKITENQLAAQAFVFVLAGSETTSSAMGFCLYELAKNPEVQRKLHKEIDSITEINYDTINNCEYLEMVIDETLRKYPPLGFLNRECARDYLVPGTDVVIQKGTQVVVSVHGMQNDPELFPEPERFDPERFSKENKDNIKSMTYMPFGEGPRFCIGMRFAKVVVKAGIFSLIRRFQVSQIPATTPWDVEPRTFITLFKGGLYLSLKERSSSNLRE